MAIKILIGGSPCTHWSIAQKNNRETEPAGMGWELFKNYLIAKEKFNPDFFLYENNKSAAQPIKDQIAHELGVGKDPGVRFTYINSALVSAQNRQRFYVTNFGDIEQPEDRGILLKDILETGTDLTQTGTFGNRNASVSEKDYCLAANPSSDMSARSIEPVRVGCYPSPDGALPINTTADDKAQCVRASCYKDGIRNLVGNDVDKRTCVAIPVEFVGEVPVKAVSCADGKEYPVYQVLNGQITIKDKQYDIKLPDGYYIIRKLTVTECCRLQTMPDDYCKAVSATQGYKGLGNGWTAEVIIHLLNHALKDVPRNEEIVVLSLYDGIGTGRYCLDKMGFTNVEYHAYEIDKYPMAIANDNYPDIIQHGDAFAVREDDWEPPQTRSQWLDKRRKSDD